MPETENLLTWLFQEALPFWSTRGVDRGQGGFYERLDPTGAILPEPRRARLVARQIYAFSAAERLGWDGPARPILRHGLAALDGFFAADGTLIATRTPEGATLSGAFDSYDHAFVLFALAAAHASGEQAEEARARAHRLLETMRAHYAHPRAGFEEGRPPTLPLKANPHMHLLEACLAWAQTAPDPAWDRLADEIAELCLAAFIDPATGALYEYFDHDWHPMGGEAKIVEPGHQFEWAWLLIRWGTLRARPDAIAAARRLVALAEAHGVDPSLGLALNTLDAELAIRDDRARLWPQTERLKAHVALRAIARDAGERAEASGKIAEAARGMMRFFAHPVAGAWWEHIDRRGEPIIEPTRASSLYHIVLAIEVLREAQGA
ncbi:AGE family epimerase/isomerase [Roseixanthobacter liquoris]|uniref:AGE family epimerase/isomerase n=1 Tax=Roseixanthobacter liquoris TaxID=3119921 RepID=UPI003726B12B